MSDYPDVDVRDFTRLLGLKVPLQEGLLHEDVFKFRMQCMMEELDEFKLAHEKGDLPEAIDAIIDLMYFAHGTLVLMGVDFNSHWNLVHEANMKKQRGITKRGSDLDAAKPVDWTPPDHTKIVGPGPYKVHERP